MSETEVLVTGGAGFIGTNLSARLATEGESVLIYDNLSRPGVEQNLEWLLRQFSPRIRFLSGDIRDAERLSKAVRGVHSVFHLAAQVAVSSSLEDPVSDFEINARGTLNLLEAVRARRHPPFLLFPSTTKVLGCLEGMSLEERGGRFEPRDAKLRESGIDESDGLGFCSPYGCSKGAAEQYVLDYARSYGLPAVVLRMSGVYGPHQCGSEEQGWVAHFIQQTLEGEPITLFGNGKQVRDALYADDLIDAFLLARKKLDSTRARAFVVGGGPSNSLSLIELAQMIGDLHGLSPLLVRKGWRPADQRYFVANSTQFLERTGWRPKTHVQEGVATLYRWLKRRRESLLANPLPRPLQVADAPEPTWSPSERSA